AREVVRDGEDKGVVAGVDGSDLAEPVPEGLVVQRLPQPGGDVHPQVVRRRLARMLHPSAVLPRRRSAPVADNTSVIRGAQRGPERPGVGRKSADLQGKRDPPHESPQVWKERLRTVTSTALSTSFRSRAGCGQTGFRGKAAILLRGPRNSGVFALFR